MGPLGLHVVLPCAQNWPSIVRPQLASVRVTQTSNWQAAAVHGPVDTSANVSPKQPNVEEHELRAAGLAHPWLRRANSAHRMGDWRKQGP
jgi:hypothetical protein